MPTTRSQKKITHYLEPNKENINDRGMKRKADGRAILGDVTNSTNKTTSNIFKTLTKNTNTTKPTNLKTATSKAPLSKSLIRKPLSTISQKQTTLKTKLKQETKLQKPKPIVQTYSGHGNSLTIPMEQWRLSLRAQLQKENKFFDQEVAMKDSHIESPCFSLGIFEYMKWREEQFEMKSYFENKLQSGFVESDRKTLVDWMVEFQEIQETTHETLYLAVRLCDYYFGRKKVGREKLQLYAFVGFLLASKFEERWPPTFEDMIYLSEDTYTREDFIDAELDMLRVLNFDINLPTSYRYLRRYAKCIGMDMQALTVARFYLELTLQEYEFVFEKQYELAAAVLWISLLTVSYSVENRRSMGTKRFLKKHWHDLLSFYVGCHEWEIVSLAKRVANVVRKSQQECSHLSIDDDEIHETAEDQRLCKVIYKKYASETFFKVALMELPSDEDIAKHQRRCESEKVDYDLEQPPNAKRRSSGACVSRLRKMNLRGSTTPKVPENPKEENKEN